MHKISFLIVTYKNLRVTHNYNDTDSFVVKFNQRPKYFEFCTILCFTILRIILY